MVCRSVLLTKEEMNRYNLRKTTIFKNAKNLSTLCDVDILLILYGPDKPNAAQTWCSRPDLITMIDCYNKCKNMNGSSRKNCRKMMKNVVKRVKKEDLRGEDHGFVRSLGLEELRDLNGVLKGKIDCVQERINFMKVCKSGKFIEGKYFDGLSNNLDFGCIDEFKFTDNLLLGNYHYNDNDDMKINDMVKVGGGQVFTPICDYFNELKFKEKGNYDMFDGGNYNEMVVKVNAMKAGEGYNGNSDGSRVFTPMGEYDEGLSSILGELGNCHMFNGCNNEVKMSGGCCSNSDGSQVVSPSMCDLGDSLENNGFVDGMNFDDLGYEVNALNMCSGDSDLMIDFSDIDNIRFADVELELLR